MYISSERDITLQKQLGIVSPVIQALYIWQPVLLKNCKKSQIPCTPPFSCQKTYVIIILPKLDRISKKLGILFQLLVLEDPNKIQNFLWIQSTSSKIMISYVFWHKNGGINEIWAFWDFSSRTGHRKCSAWVVGDPFYAYEG